MALDFEEIDVMQVLMIKFINLTLKSIYTIRILGSLTFLGTHKNEGEDTNIIECNISIKWIYSLELYYNSR